MGKPKILRLTRFEVADFAARGYAFVEETTSPGDSPKAWVIDWRRMLEEATRGLPVDLVNRLDHDWAEDSVDEVFNAERALATMPVEARRLSKLQRALIQRRANVLEIAVNECDFEPTQVADGTLIDFLEAALAMAEPSGTIRTCRFERITALRPDIPIREVRRASAAFLDAGAVVTALYHDHVMIHAGAAEHWLRQHPKAPTRPAAGQEVGGDRSLVFVVYGRNVKAYDAMKAFLRSLGLTSIDFNTLSAELGGSPFVGDVVKTGIGRAQAVIVLFTPDELATLDERLTRANDRDVDRTRHQARPNVLFEAGIAMGLKEDRTILVPLGADVSLFSDVEGRHLTKLDNGSESRRTLRERLVRCGCTVDAAAEDWTERSKSGDFEACLSP
jgi:predicted nucleotide-binding protein